MRFEVRLTSLNKRDGEREKGEKVRGREKDGERVCLRRTMIGLMDNSVSARIAESSRTLSTLSLANVRAILPRDITSKFATTERRELFILELRCVSLLSIN